MQRVALKSKLTAPAEQSAWQPLRNFDWSPDQRALERDADGKLQPTKAQLRATYFMSRQGMSLESIAYCLGVSPGSLTRWRKEDARVSYALRAGVAHGEGAASGVVAARIARGDLDAAKFFLRVKCKWKDDDGTGPTSAPPQHPPERDAIAEALRRLTDDEFREVTGLLSRAAGRAVVDGRGAPPE